MAITKVFLCFVALLSLTTALGYRTTITTTVLDEQSRECRQQFEQQQELYHCQMYLSPRSQIVLLQTQEMEHLNDCCQQLEQMSERCRCDALRQVVQKQQQQQGRYEAQEMGDIVRRAESLPQKCNLTSDKCKIRAVFF